MKTVALAILLSGGLAAAQTPSMTPDSQQVQSDPQTAPDQATVKPQTIRGCLNSAGDNYTVTDQVSGKTFKLEGSTDRLKQYIGQTVEITGSVKSVDGDSKPATASVGDILTLADVKQVSDKCSTVPQNGALVKPAAILLAVLQRPVSDDANTQLNSSEQMSSNAQDTSAAAANTRSVTTNTQEHAVLNVSGHQGPHGYAATTSDTTTVGQTTPPTNSMTGYAATHNPSDKGVSPPAKYPANRQSEANGDTVLPTPNADAMSSSEEEGNRAAVSAARAEMQTDANGDKTTYSTQRPSEANGAAAQNSSEKKKATPKQPK